MNRFKAIVLVLAAIYIVWWLYLLWLLWPPRLDKLDEEEDL